MPVHNTDVAAIFEEIADLLDLRSENPFRIRAYRNAARAIRDLGKEVRDMVAAGEDLKRIEGVGEDLAKKIVEIVQTGGCAALEGLRAGIPAGVLELLRLPGLGPKKVKKLHEKLKINTLADLRAAAHAKKIRELEGFGEKSEQQILQALEAKLLAGKRFRLDMVEPYAHALVQHLRNVSGVQQVAVAGSYRRRKETVGDLDILIVAKDYTKVSDAFVGYDEVRHVLAKGDTKSSVLLASGIQVDLRVVEAESFGAALNYFTGSKDHNIAIRKLGQQRGLKINEYGVFRDDRYVVGRTEEEVYGAVDLTYIPPELREDSGEIQAARDGRLPHLIEEADLKGDLHVHTVASDGQNTIQEMAEAALALGYEYLAIADHSKRQTVAHGMDAKRLMKQIEEIERVNENLKGITVLKAIEVDILEDGSLDMPKDALRHLDLVIGAVHSHFNLPDSVQTERILRAVDHPYFSILAHPTGRLLLEREGYRVDLPRIMEHAKARGCFLELNAHPSRLDLNDAQCRMACDLGVLICINTDAHSTRNLEAIRFGVAQARRGWVEKKNVLNTSSLAELRKLIARTMG